LLNCIDGIASPEGNLIFMTTNHPEHLSEALIRPGRVDVKIHFDLASHYQLRSLMRYFFPDASKADLEKFVDRVPDRKYSTAEIQGLFIENRTSAKQVLADLDGFFERVEKQRRATMELKRLAELRKKKEEDVEEENKDTETAKTSKGAKKLRTWKNNENDNVEQDTIKTDKTESNGHEKPTKTSDAEDEGSNVNGVEIEAESPVSTVDIKKKNK